MRKRWLGLHVENEIGVLARISGLFAGKSYNLDTISIGTTEDTSISRMTISLTSDDQTFEQIKKQLNRSVEVIKVIDLTDRCIRLSEVLFAQIHDCTPQDIDEAFRFAEVYHLKVIDYEATGVILEGVGSEAANDAVIKKLARKFPKRVEIIWGGSVAVELLNQGRQRPGPS